MNMTWESFWDKKGCCWIKPKGENEIKHKEHRQFYCSWKAEQVDKYIKRIIRRILEELLEE